MIYCKELDTKYETKEELFKALKSNIKDIIAVKKKTIYTGYDVSDPENSKQVVSSSQVKLKSLLSGASKDFFKDDKYYYIAVNTTGILDSHNDLHVKGIWDKSSKKQSGKNYLVDTHNLTVKDIIAYPEDVEIFVADIPFKSIGKSYEGNTEALIYKVLKTAIVGENIRKALESGKTMQASVKMLYVDMELAMNSDDPDDAAEKSLYDKTVNSIANLKDFDTPPLYYLIHKEAENIHESSLVPFGSNGATGVVNISEPKENKKSFNNNFYNLI